MRAPSVLIVDDVSDSRNLLRRILLGFGCTETREESRGERALASYILKRPDIVFLDIEMPGQGGLETLRELLSQDPKAYIVMLSASSTFENIKKTLDIGAKRFIVKPYNTEKVKEAILCVQRGLG